MNKSFFFVLCVFCLVAIPVHAEDNFWDRPPHPDGSYGYDELLPDLLNIKGLPYNEARPIIIGAGWNPQQTLQEGTNEYENDAMSGTGKIVWKKGFHELQSCTGGGPSYCAFLFLNKNGDQFRVTAKGEDWGHEPPSSAKVSGYRFFPKN